MDNGGWAATASAAAAGEQSSAGEASGAAAAAGEQSSGGDGWQQRDEAAARGLGGVVGWRRQKAEAHGPGESGGFGVAVTVAVICTFIGTVTVRAMALSVWPSVRLCVKPVFFRSGRLPSMFWAAGLFLAASRCAGKGTG